MNDVRRNATPSDPRRGAAGPAVGAMLAALFWSAGAWAAGGQAVDGTFAGEHGASGPTGHFDGTFDQATGRLSWRITYADLSGPVLAAHFHGPAKPGVEAGVLVPIRPPYASPMTGSVTLTPAEAKDLADGEVYVNLHTKAHPDGEARADLTEH